MRRARSGILVAARRHRSTLAKAAVALDESDRRRADGIRLGVSAPSFFSSGLVDHELDQRAGIEVEAQRRPSETYSAALLPEPRSLAGLVGR